MGNRAVKQPNGMYARFSDIVDDFTHYDCTREELLNIYKTEMGDEQAIGKLDRADKHPERFEEELNTVKNIHGETLYLERLKQMSELKGGR